MDNEGSIKSEILQLDGLRGVSAIWVVLFHYLLFLKVSSGLNLGFFQSVITKGYLGVDIFFILSGFIISYRYGNKFNKKISLYGYGSFLKNRIARIYPSYFLALIMILVFFLFGSLKAYAAGFAVYNFKTFILNIFMVQCWLFKYCQWSWNLPGWTVSVEWFLYIVFPFLSISILRNKGVIYLLFKIILSCSILFYLICANKQFFIMKGMEFGLIRGITEFLIGCSIFQLTEKIKIKPSLYFDYVAIFSLLGLVLATHYKINDFISIVFITALIFSLNLSVGFLKKLFSIYPMRYLGKLSYTIYIFQFPFQIISNHFFSNISANNYYLHLLMYLAQVVALVIISSLIFFFYENPLRIIIKKVKIKFVLK